MRNRRDKVNDMLDKLYEKDVTGGVQDMDNQIQRGTYGAGHTVRDRRYGTDETGQTRRDIGAR